MVADYVSDTITRLYNSSLMRSEISEVLWSKLTENIVNVLKEASMIEDYEIVEKPFKEGGKIMNVKLKYDLKGDPLIMQVKRISKPGCRVYRSHDEIKKVKNGRGLGIYSTSQGVMSDKNAYQKGLGGEYLCEIW